MALTWRNVDVPTGLNQAAGQVQQSFKDVANSLKAGIDQYSSMKQNDQMSALEARLSQEEQLAGVDQLTALDAGQLRKEFGGWIDPTQAREMITNRQAGLVQQEANNFNQQFAAGNLEGAAESLKGLEGRGDFDASALRTQVNNEQFTRGLQEEDLSELNPTNAAQAEQLRLTKLNRSLASNNENGFTQAKLLAQTPEELQRVKLAENTFTVNQAFPKYAQKLQAAINDPNLDIGAGNKVINDITTKLYDGTYDLETIGKLSTALTPLKQAVAQKEMNAVTVAPEVQTLVQDGITKAPEAAAAILQPKFNDLQARALQAGVPLELSEIYGNLNNLTAVNEGVNLNTPDGITKLNDIVKSLDFKSSWFGRDFDARAVMERLNKSEVDVNGISYGGLVAALSQVDFNRWFGGDKKENEDFALALQAEKGKTETRIKAAVNFNNERLQLNKEKAMLEANIAAGLVDRSKQYTVRNVGAGLSGEQLLELNPYSVGESIFSQQLQEAKAKLKETAPASQPVNEEIDPVIDPPNLTPETPVDPFGTAEERAKRTEEEWKERQKQVILQRQEDRLNLEANQNRVREEVKSVYPFLSKEEKIQWFKENAKYLSTFERRALPK